MVWPHGMPEGRPIQKETIGVILDIIADTERPSCIAVVQPPGTGKTWYYRALQCAFGCVVLVLIPLVPLLDEALQGALDAGLPAIRITDLYGAADIGSVLQSGCLVFCSFEAACNDVTWAVLDYALESVGAITVVDEAHMLHLDMRYVVHDSLMHVAILPPGCSYRHSFRGFWQLGAMYGQKMPFILLTATMRPSLEIPVSYAFLYLFCILSDALQQLMFDLVLEDVDSFKTIRSPSDRNRNIKIEWYTTLDEANAWLIKEKPEIIFVMTK
jgi:hypothetical protein